ncbi:glycosyltransferase involved in cell wall biosynthesis [Glaciihabitans tibetensis]|uniref:Glycosyltransferase involved in cell wall biosynthesis n=1 Tax=Glaciihabitans tibetensis TaxID=1266600 RepID=A0A2T0VFC5_9MICO|nr:glycosyltransferase family 4 protein [Glaciihabitans tibetensis]PRY68910.1 glycosyltransferase involved in cell wall biosynthesis [Glaciihabitans tibetensis]
MAEPRAAIIFDCLFPATTGGGERVYRRIAEEFVQRHIVVDYLTRDLGDVPTPGFTVVPVWNGDIYDESGARTTSSALYFARGVYRHLRAYRGEYDIVVASALPVLTVLAAALALRGSRSFLVVDWLEVWTLRKWRSYSGALTGSLAFLLQVAGARVGDLHTVNSTFTARRLQRHRRGAAPVVLGLVDLVDPAPAAAMSPSPSGETPDRVARAAVIPEESDQGDVAAGGLAPFLLFVGRHIADKRIDTLPAALAELHRSRPDVTLVVAGSGPETARLEAAVRRAGVGDSVHLVGRVSDERLAELTSSAAVLVNPSAREGFGLVVAEAAAYGTPSIVVAGEDNAAVDLIVEGVNGFVAASVEPAELARAVARALDGGEALRGSTAAWFARERVSRSLAVSVDEILARHRAALGD